MKRHFAVTIAALAMALSAHAIRPIHKLFPVKQSDGTTVMLYKNGDGHLAFYTTEDHQVVVRNADGTLCYAQLQNGQLVATTIVCHNLSERTEAEQAFVASNTLRPSDTALTPLLAPARTIAKAGNASTSDGLGKYGTPSGGRVPTIGSLTIPVIMVQFADKKFQDGMTTEKLSRFFNTEGYNEDNTLQRGSVKDYFVAQSRGLFTPSFDVVAMVTLDYGYAHYGANGSSGGDSNAYAMVSEAVAAAVKQGVDFSKYVDSSRGYVPNVTIFYAGEGEATGGGDDTIWPHELDLPTYYQTMSGTQFGSYYVGNELYYDNMPMGMGVFVHEFSHAMGLPDFYVTNYSYSNDDPFGLWSVMDGGSYDNSTYAPVGYNAYERSYMGWLDIKELSAAETVTLTDPNLNEGQMAVMFRNPSNNNEYFILENRQPGTWYNSAYGSGLMVTRFAYSALLWQNNTLNNTQKKKRALIITADGSTLNSSAKQSNLYGNGVNAKTSHDTYTGNTMTDYGIYKIIQQPDGTITFNFKDASLTPEFETDGNQYKKVTDLAQLSDKDEVILVNEATGVALANAEEGMTRIADVKVTGDVAQTTAAALKFTVRVNSSNQWSFNAASQGGYLCVDRRKGLTLVSKMATGCNATIAITDGNASLDFNGSASAKSLGYDTDTYAFGCYATTPSNIQIYRKVTSTGIQAVQTNETIEKAAAVYTLGGQYVGTSLTGLPKGIYIQQGKKVVVK